MKHTPPDAPLPLFDFSGPGGPEKKPATPGLDAGRAARDEGMGRAALHADFDWLAAALNAVRMVAEARAEFTVDAVQARLVELGVGRPPEGRAMGAVMVSARQHGLIEGTDKYEPSSQPQCHANPRRVWKSLVYKGATG